MSKLIQPLFRTLSISILILLALVACQAVPNLRAQVYSNSGNELLEKGELDEAIAAFDQALQVDPDLAEAYLGRGTAYYQKGEYDRAISDLDQAIRIDPNSAAAYTQRGNAYDDQGDPDRAIADYDQAIRIDPNFAGAYNNRGLAYAQLGDIDRAIADYDQALQLDPEYAAAYFHRGLVFHDQGEPERAMADFNQAILLKPEVADGYNYRGIVYGENGCQVTVELGDDQGEFFAIYGEGFIPKETLRQTSNSEGEIIEDNFDVDEAGKFRLMMMPAVIGKQSGTDRITFTGQQCEVVVEYEWGLAAVNEKR